LAKSRRTPNRTKSLTWRGASWLKLRIPPIRKRPDGLWEVQLSIPGRATPKSFYSETHFADYDDRFWLNGNYSVYPEPSEKACMEVARIQEGYFVGLLGCPERTWSPEGGYSDPFVPLPVLNLRPA
jgi:hypothetical protein